MDSIASVAEKALIILQSEPTPSAHHPNVTHNHTKTYQQLLQCKKKKKKEDDISITLVQWLCWCGDSDGQVIIVVVIIDDSTFHIGPDLWQVSPLLFPSCSKSKWRQF